MRGRSSTDQMTQVDEGDEEGLEELGRIDGRAQMDGVRPIESGLIKESRKRIISNLEAVGLISNVGWRSNVP